jgi:hypothetical protein
MNLVTLIDFCRKWINVTEFWTHKTSTPKGQVPAGDHVVRLHGIQNASAFSRPLGSLLHVLNEFLGDAAGVRQSERIISPSRYTVCLTLNDRTKSTRETLQSPEDYEKRHQQKAVVTTTTPGTTENLERSF